MLFFCLLVDTVFFQYELGIPILDDEGVLFLFDMWREVSEFVVLGEV